MGTAATSLPAIAVTSNAGATWSPELVPASVLSLSGIACTSLRNCVVVGQSGTAGAGTGSALFTRDGGLAWSASTVPTEVTGISAVTCVSSTCFAVASTAGGPVVLDSTSGGLAWAEVGALPTSWISAGAISCADSHHCWVTAQQPIDATHGNGVVAATTDGGTTWTPVTLPAGLGALYAISCGGGGGFRCVAVGSSSTVLTQIGSGAATVVRWSSAANRWSVLTTPAVAAAWVGISCVAADTCALVGPPTATSGQAGVLAFAGPPADVWRRLATVPTAAPLLAVACVDPRHCLAVGDGISARLVTS